MHRAPLFILGLFRAVDPLGRFLMAPIHAQNGAKFLRCIVITSETMQKLAAVQVKLLTKIA